MGAVTRDVCNGLCLATHASGMVPAPGERSGEQLFGQLTSPLIRIHKLEGRGLCP